MFLAQAPRTPGLHVAVIADLAPARAREALARVGWPAERYEARSPAAALKSGGTFITDDAAAAIAADGIDVVIDATGHPPSGIRHALLCCEHGKHIVMVNVEADVLAGPLLDVDGRPSGSLLVIDVNDRAEAEGFAAGDPYAKAGLFESTIVRPFREVFRDGERSGA